METLESVVGDRNPLDGRLQAAQAETEVIVFSLLSSFLFLFFCFLFFVFFFPLINDL